MRKKISIIILILIIGCIILSSCSSGEGEIPILKGKVYYNDTDSMVYNAEVLLDGKVRDKTDYAGEFYITDLNKDSYTLKIRKKEIIEDYVETVYPTVNSNLGIIRVEAIGDTTIINGQVTINNETGYFSEIKTASVNSTSNIKFNTSNKGKYVEDEIIVKYDNSTITSSSNAVQEVQGLNISQQLNRETGNLVKFKMPAGKKVEEMIDYFSQQPGIEYAEPNYYVYAQSIPNDKYYEDRDNEVILQWGLISTNMEAAWDRQQDSNSVTVAVLDTGIIPGHKDFDDKKLVNGANFIANENNDDPRNYIGDDNFEDKSSAEEDGSHGTHVAGIIGASTDNNIGVAGVSWGINIMPVKVLANGGSGDLFDLLEGIYYSVDKGADILNLSLEVPAENNISSLEEAIKYAYNKNRIIVASSGNDGVNSISYPAFYRETIAVGAVDLNNKLTNYSNYGSKLDLVAPGGDADDGILSTWGYYDGENYIEDYEYMNGTSMSSAFVSGAAALLLESGVRPQAVKDRLTSTAVDLGTEGKDKKYGYGLLDVYGALLGKRLETPYVFAATESNDTLIIESNSTRMNSDGSYTLSDRISGDYYMVAWRDVNDNLKIDRGDYFGKTDSRENYQPGEVKSGQDIDMYYVTGSSSASSLNVEGIEKLRD